MNFWQMSVRRVEKKYRVVYKHGPSRVAMFFAGMALMSWLIFLLLTGFPLAQYVYYTAVPATSDKLAKVLSEIETAPELVVRAENEPEEQIEPVTNTVLPEGRVLKIPSIGVESQIIEAPKEEYESAFRKGVWRVPDMAEPNDGRPVILAAHRFGYLEWTNEFRKEKSFFNLPKVEAGEEVEILWDQKIYKYRIDKVEEGTEISNYETDLILYTCKFLVSPIRILVYATRVN